MKAAVRHQSEKLLGAYRVLDLTDEKGLACGKLLADLGAEVIKVEKPGGDPARSIGPFYGDVPHPEKSLFWWAFNQGKKGITLNLEKADGQELFRSLVKVADIVVESYSPGYLDSIGLGYAALNRINPALIYSSITAFGETGPYSRYKESDLVVTALSGYMYLCGDPHGPPLRVSFPIAYCLAAIDAAAGSLIALHYRTRTGKGQKVDTSAQQVVARHTIAASPFWEIEGRLLKRPGPGRPDLTSRVRSPQLWRCKDGFISFAIYGGQIGARVNKPLMAWMETEGMVDDFLRSIDWGKLDMAVLTQEFFDEVQKRLSAFFLSHTKAELLRGAVQRGIILCPVYKTGDILKDEQLQARRFWTEIDHPELGRKITYPGPFAGKSDPLIGGGTRAPLIGEHNSQVYGELLGLHQKELERLKRNEVI